MNRKPFVILCFLLAIGCAPHTTKHPNRIYFVDDEHRNLVAKIQAIDQLKSGNKIRLQTRDTGLFEGKFRHRDEAIIAIDIQQEESMVSIADIETIWVRRGLAGQGAKIGGIVFGIIGTLAGTAMSMLCGFAAINDDTADAECPEYIALGTFGGAAAGALIGAGLGAADRRWHQLYP